MGRAPGGRAAAASGSGGEQRAQQSGRVVICAVAGCDEEVPQNSFLCHAPCCRTHATALSVVLRPRRGRGRRVAREGQGHDVGQTDGQADGQASAAALHHRFCNQCVRFHTLDHFDGSARVCRRAKQRRVERRRQRRRGKSSPSESWSGDFRREIGDDSQGTPVPRGDAGSEERPARSTSRVTDPLPVGASTFVNAQDAALHPQAIQDEQLRHFVAAHVLGGTLLVVPDNVGVEGLSGRGTSQGQERLPSERRDTNELQSGNVTGNSPPASDETDEWYNELFSSLQNPP